MYAFESDWVFFFDKTTTFTFTWDFKSKPFSLLRLNHDKFSIK